VDTDLQVRRSSADALLQAAAALNNQVPQPREGEAPLDTKDDRDLKLFEETRAALLPLLEVFKGETAALARALTDTDLEVRVATQRALEELGAARQRLLHPPRPRPEPAVPPRPEGQRGAALDQGRLTPVVTLEFQAKAEPDPILDAFRDLLPTLIAQVGDTEVQIRLGAIDVLETLGGAAAPAASALVRATLDPNRFVRWAAARTLGKMGSVEPAAAVPAVAHLLFDDDLDVRLSAAVALDRFGPAAEGAVPELVRAMKASDADVREAAIRTVGGIGTGAQAAVPALAAAVADPDSRVRIMAAEVLGRFGTLAASAEPALRNALDDPDSDVRRAASDALLSILQAQK